MFGYVQTQDFAWLAFHEHLEWPTTNLTVCGKPLFRNARVYREVETLTAKRALN